MLLLKRRNEGSTGVADRLREYSWNLDPFGEMIWKVDFSAFNLVDSLALTHVYPTKIKLSVETGAQVKHKYQILIPLWITTPISMFPACSCFSVHLRNNKGKNITGKIYC